MPSLRRRSFLPFSFLVSFLVFGDAGDSGIGARGSLLPLDSPAKKFPQTASTFSLLTIERAPIKP